MKYAKFGHCKWQIIKPEDCEIPTVSLTIYKKAWAEGDYLIVRFPGIELHVVGEATDVDDNSFTVK